MRFSAENVLGENPDIIMRRLGYHYHGFSPEKSEMSFIRPLRQTAYPRFHVYLRKTEKSNEMLFNLHLDQKRPIYKGVTAHSGEYGGELLAVEAERIKAAFVKAAN